MLHFGLIGEKLGHSLSVPIHEAVWRKIGLDADYRLIELAPDAFDAAVPRLMAELDGFNVTIPYKRRIIGCLADTDGDARTIGAVNTVLCAGRTGHNTDVYGFRLMLESAGIDPAGKPCFILGTGGASAAACAALRGMGAGKVVFVSRSGRDGAVPYESLEERFAGILVNCTPAGMWPDTEGCPLPVPLLRSLLKRADAAADVIYNPRETVLLREAARAGIPCAGGMTMLIGQAVAAEEIWLGRSLPEGLTETLARELKLL